MSDITKPKIVVRGNNILKPPLFETEDASIIEFHDKYGDLMALFCKVLAGDVWGLVMKGDPDWTAMLVRYGYLDPKRPVMDIIRSGL